MRPRRAGHATCSSSSASGAPRTRATSTRTSRMARSPIIGAARRTRARTCCSGCIIAACCVWSGATTACACTPCSSIPRSPMIRHRARAASMRWSMSWCANTPRCLQRASRIWCGGCGTARRSSCPTLRRRWRAHGSDSRMPASTAWTGTGRPASGCPGAAQPCLTRCACSPRSTPSSGTGGASSSSGIGPIASRRTRPRASASSATMRSRCCGATR